ncbi:MAG TPA: VOC family protein [Solirubrobacteraceae bacterium]|nr:VOC family protein [Solirubrobacteraceae bacterium]
MPDPTPLPRLRQAVVAATQLEPTVQRLRDELGLGEPYSDPAVGFFGLRNAVFALQDTFLEVVSPVKPDTAAGRLMQRRGGDCGYMLMFQVDDLAAARARVGKAAIREVFEIDREDISEVHLHPRDIRAAIVSLSQPKPPASWPWGGDGWDQRAAPARVIGATVAVTDPDDVAQRWQDVIGDLPGIRLEREDSDRGLTEIVIATRQPRPEPLEIAGVRFVLVSTEEDR